MDRPQTIFTNLWRVRGVLVHPWVQDTAESGFDQKTGGYVRVFFSVAGWLEAYPWA